MARKRTQSIKPVESDSADFVVISPSAMKTTGKTESSPLSSEEIARRELDSAVREYNWANKMSSVIIDDKGSVLNPTPDYINSLADYPQDDLKKTLNIIRLISKMVNVDDIIGKTVESVRVNINTDYRLSYKAEKGRNKSKSLKEAKQLISDFNEEIKLKRIIREKVPDAYQDGTVILYLRSDGSDGWVVDVYPLGVAIIAPYTIGGESVVLIDINELKARLQKAGFKTRSGKDMFFPTIESEIKANYPESVYDAYKKKEPYAQLDVAYSGVVKIGDRGKLYGLSPIFRSLGSALILQSFYKSDEANARARAKKILFQNFKKEVLGKDFEKNPLTEMALSHRELLNAYRQNGSVVYTGTGWIEDLKYVEPKSDLIDTKTIAYHLNREMSTLGIGFLSAESANQSVSTATISLEQLMKTINSITEQFEEIFKKWYAQVLVDSGFDASYAPDIKILDSEALEFKLKKELATFFYSVLNLSMRTTLETLGYDLTEEVTRRTEENEQKLQDVFFPRVSQFNVSKDTPTNGRPPAENETDKTKYDDEYNKTRT